MDLATSMIEVDPNMEEGMPELMTSSLQELVGVWADATFPKATPESILAHFREEADEFLENGDLEEGADCLILLLHYFHKLGTSLSNQTYVKLEKNRQRKWATEPNEKGYFKHIEEAPKDEGQLPLFG